MPSFRIHRIKDAPRENFRWSAHTGGLAIAKSRDYELGGIVDATSPYAAWKSLAAEGQSLRPGDLLEKLLDDQTSGTLLIAKYIGFEPAQWFVPGPKPDFAADAGFREAGFLDAGCIDTDPSKNCSEVSSQI